MIKLCALHHLELIAELVRRGLAAYMPLTQEEALAKWDLARLTGMTKTSFEPVQFAAMAIILNAQQAGLLTGEAGGDVCPICSSDQDRTNWLPHAAQDAVKEAQRLGLKVDPIITN